MPTKIITEIAIKRKPEDQGDLRRPIDLIPFPEDPTRRRIGETKKWLNVYDLHRNADGSDRPYSRYATLRLDPGPGPGYQAPLYDSLQPLFPVPGFINAYAIGETEPATVADWNQYVLPGGDPDDLPSTRRKITSELAAYRITFDGIGVYSIEPQGIEIPENVTAYKGSTSASNAIKWNLLAQPNFEAWLDRTLTNSASVAQKITMVPNYFSASATITVDKSIDVFLAPSVYSSSGHSRGLPFSPGPHPYLPQTWFYNMGSARTINRSDSLSDPAFIEFWDYVDSPPTMTSAPGPIKDYYMEYFQRDSRSAYTLWVDSMVAVPPFPSYLSAISGVTNAGFLQRYPAHNNRLGTIGAGSYAGMLKALIRKHLDGGDFEWYYVWSNTFWTGAGIMPWIVGGTIGVQYNF